MTTLLICGSLTKYLKISLSAYKVRNAFLAAIFLFSGAERLHVLREIPGLSIPDHLLARVESHNGERESPVITLELVNGIREIEGISGLYTRSIGAEGWVPRIVTAAVLGGEPVYQRRAERAP